MARPKRTDPILIGTVGRLTASIAYRLRVYALEVRQDGEPVYQRTLYTGPTYDVDRERMQRYVDEAAPTVGALLATLRSCDAYCPFDRAKPAGPVVVARGVPDTSVALALATAVPIRVPVVVVRPDLPDIFRNRRPASIHTDEPSTS